MNIKYTKNSRAHGKFPIDSPGLEVLGPGHFNPNVSLRPLLQSGARSETCWINIPLDAIPAIIRALAAHIPASLQECPACSNDDLESDGFDGDGSTIVCTSCQHEWRENYLFIGNSPQL